MSQSAYGSISAQGLYNQEVSFTSTITTTSTSDVLLTGMTITPPAGTYLVLFSTWLTQSTGNDVVTMSIYAGGSQIAASVRSAIPFVGALSAVTQDMPLSTNGIITVNGSQAIAINWHVNGGTGSAHTGTLDVLKVG